MTPGFFKWSVVTALMTVAFLFTQCGKPFADKGDLIYSTDASALSSPMGGVNPQSSLEAFERTVYQVTRQNCTSCHGSSQQPLHASSDSQVAHNAVLNQYKVNFTTPSQSRLVKKLRDDRHQCWSNCDNDAQEMQDAIVEWKELMEAEQVPTAPTENFKKTAQSRTILAERAAVTAGTVIHTAMAGNATLTAPMVLRPAVGMNPAYVEAPNNGVDNNLGANDGAAGIARFTISSTVARTNGALWGLVNIGSTSDDSFYAGINAAAVQSWTSPVTNGMWKWMRMTGNHNLAVGMNTVNIRERKNGAQLAKILYTPDQNFVPGGEGTAGTITLRYPLDALGVAGASLEVKIEDYDAFSYRLSALRINTPRNLYVANIRVLLNGTYNPQHSNYTLIDQMVPAGGAPLSPANMIVLKEGGESVDKLSFGFEILEFR